MPNYASTEYCFKGTTEQAKDLYDKIDSLSKMAEPLVENGFGKLWMGCLVNLLGNDSEGLYFKDRYCLDFYDGLEYFETIETAAEFIGERIGKTLKPDFAEIEKEIDDYLEEHEDDEKCWMSFHKFEVLND